LLGGFLSWAVDNHIGDLASIAGLIVSIVGFLITIYNVMRSRKAAERAKEAAQKAVSSIRSFEAVVDLSSIIGMLEEIKRTQRSNQWALLPDRYASLRKTLISLRQSHDLAEQHSAVIQSTIVNLRDIEDAVEKALPDAPTKSYARFNALLSNNIDDLVRVLAELKLSETGG
jgi:ABC-type protease/lipase transport system fused ATPase/permease subunit